MQRGVYDMIGCVALGRVVVARGHRARRDRGRGHCRFIIVVVVVIVVDRTRRGTTARHRGCVDGSMSVTIRSGDRSPV